VRTRPGPSGWTIGRHQPQVLRRVGVIAELAQTAASFVAVPSDGMRHPISREIVGVVDAGLLGELALRHLWL
jgi:hypothetical protein